MKLPAAVFLRDLSAGVDDGPGVASLLIQAAVDFGEAGTMEDQAYIWDWWVETLKLYQVDRRKETADRILEGELLPEGS